MKINLRKLPLLVAVSLIGFALVTVLLAFDIDKCLSSCDTQYADCVKRMGGTADGIKYCSLHHDKCRKDCMEHK
jgi:hypothetical protein